MTASPQEVRLSRLITELRALADQAKWGLFDEWVDDEACPRLPVVAAFDLRTLLARYEDVPGPDLGAGSTRP